MYYKNQTVLLASKHEKELAISKPFSDRLACSLHVHDFDTDRFGTFTGEVPRSLSAFETCYLKAKTAANTYGYNLAVASEGSFGVHPSIPFLPSAHEWMVFVDIKRNWIISEQILSQKTNYATLKFDSKTNIDTFLTQVKFPSHALVLQKSDDNSVIAKGIKDLDSLYMHIENSFKFDKNLILATDMRAMMNPTRMGVIAELADKLATKIATSCPKCESPGFGFKDARGNLPCSICGFATSFHKEEVWGCVNCDYQEYKMRADGLLSVDPTYCVICNP